MHVFFIIIITIIIIIIIILFFSLKVEYFHYSHGKTGNNLCKTWQSGQISGRFSTIFSCSNFLTFHSIVVKYQYKRKERKKQTNKKKNPLFSKVKVLFSKKVTLH